MAAGVVAILGFVWVVIYMIGSFVRGARTIDSRHHMLATGLGGAILPDGRLAVSSGGVWVAVSFTRAGTVARPTRWTYVEAALPAGYPLALFVRAHVYTDALQIQRGEMVDVVMGDAEFDAAFLVEGAPAEVVRNLLTPEVRASLLRETPIKLDVVNGVLQLMFTDWTEQVEQLQARVALVGALAGRVRDAFGAADAAIPLATSGGVYREIPDDQPLEDARAARFTEVKRLGQVQQRRGVPWWVSVLFVLLAVVAVISETRC